MQITTCSVRFDDELLVIYHAFTANLFRSFLPNTEQPETCLTSWILVDFQAHFGALCLWRQKKSGRTTGCRDRRYVILARIQKDQLLVTINSPIKAN